jgi:archaellum component FlaC
MTMSTIDRSLLRVPGLSSPKLSVKREMTPPAVSDPALLHIHDRLNQLDSKVLDVRTAVLTKDAYVDRRNREDEFIRREFEGQRQLAGRIDSNVGRVKTDVSQLKTDLNQLKMEIIQLRTQVVQLGSKEAFLHTDVNQLQSDVTQLQNDVQELHTDVCGTRTDLSQIQAIVSQLRIDLMTLQRETSQHFGAVFSRFSAMESRMKYMDRIRFNSLAHTIHAPITPVPVVEEDGSVKFPDYFPRTVWKFWCLKKRNRRESGSVRSRYTTNTVP